MHDKQINSTDCVNQQWEDSQVSLKITHLDFKLYGGRNKLPFQPAHHESNIFILKMYLFIHLILLIIVGPFFFIDMINNEYPASFKNSLLIVFLLLLGITGILIMINHARGKRLTMHINLKDESVTLYNKEGHITKQYGIKDIQNLRLTYDTGEKYLNLGHNVPKNAYKRIHILDLVITNGTSHPVHAGDEDEVRDIADKLANFINRPIQDEGSRSLKHNR